MTTTCSKPVKNLNWKVSVLPDGRWLLYNPSENATHTLTAEAGILWELCDGQSSVEAITTEIRNLYSNSAIANLQEQVMTMIDDLIAKELIYCADLT